MKKATMTVDVTRKTGFVSKTLFGIFIEDISHSLDGGLNANMVRNHSFDDLYLKKTNVNDLKFVLSMVGRQEREEGHLRYWSLRGGTMESRADAPVSSNSRYLRVHSEASAVLENKGYNVDFADRCAIAIKSGHTYIMSLYLRSTKPGSCIRVCVTDPDGTRLTEESALTASSSWTQVTTTLSGMADGYGKLRITFEGSGSTDLDCMELYDADHWGKGDPRWSQGKMRRDLVEALMDLQPKFVRFPGGCIVEGIESENEYHWKDSIGPLTDRKGDFNLWAIREKDFGYTQSRQIGFYEFFLLCEDLGAEPLPIVWSGQNCQMRRRGAIPGEGPQFEAEVVQNALDLIEYANGDPETSKWAKMRADAGHPEPFNLKYIGIGNENFGEDYFKRFRQVKKAIDAKHTGIRCVLGSGSDPKGKNFDDSWQAARKDLHDVYVDEHFYKKPSEVIGMQGRYDSYDRSGAKVFLGEYAAYNVVADTLFHNVTPNTFETALAEAAFLTGIERNADVVAMTCFAPLFAAVQSIHWGHNLVFFNPGHVLKTVNYYVQQMFSGTIGDAIVEINDSLPKGVFGSATCGGPAALCVKLVNTTDSELDMTLHVKGLVPSSLKVTSLQSFDKKARNVLSYDGKAEEALKPVIHTETAGPDCRFRLLPKSFSVLQFD